ncbi:MAG: hypothetical protein NVSMB52_06190 [Chloroflexota bacterium]
MNTQHNPKGKNRPLHGVNVLITRAGKDAALFREKLEGCGASVIELPTVAIEPSDDTSILDDALENQQRYHWIAFTSRNAVQIVYGRLEALGLPPVLLPRIAAVGPSTASEVENYGSKVECAPHQATASDLARTMGKLGLAGVRVLIPAGDIARHELAHGLRDAGALVDQIVVYRTVQPLETRRASLDSLRTGGVDVIALASPSAIRNLSDMLGAHVPVLQHVKLACIGPSTAAAVHSLGLQPAITARNHTLEGLVESIVDLYSEGS